MILTIGLIGPEVGNANAIQNHPDNNVDVIDFANVTNDSVLSEELLQIEEEINVYLEEIPYTESDYENMSEEEFEEVYANTSRVKNFWNWKENMN
ncbi:hypothetical protein [Bacillus massilinigeriensis]|uniref:hypothetical protein n=1 Tax=Bacillus mediterraneensis TaxID=1805474 RepID=UPI0008F84D72|nr:hypothetical protein [Bacillus mediterraneensis]